MGTAEQRNQRIKQELENWGSDFRNRLSVPEIALTALLYTRFRYVLWALFAASVLGILWFGLQDVGSYYGYEAGSLFRPEHYVDTAWTATFGDSYGFSAADINRELSAMRLANLPGVLGCGVVLLASAALTFWVGLGALLAGGVWEALFKMEPSVQRFFLERYRIDHPTESGRPAIEDVARYAWQYVCDKRCDTGIPGTVIDAEMVYELRKFLAQEKLFGGYLALNGLPRHQGAGAPGAAAAVDIRAHPHHRGHGFCGRSACAAGCPGNSGSRFAAGTARAGSCGGLDAFCPQGAARANRCDGGCRRQGD